MKRRWITRADLCVLLCLLLATAALYLLLRPRGAGDTVYIYVGNELYDEFGLEDAPEEYTVSTQKGSLTLAFDEVGVSVLFSDCPDDVCVRTGKIKGMGESIVCAPLGVCVTVGENALDGVTG